MTIPRLTIACALFAVGWVGGCLVPKPHDPKPPTPITQPAKETRLVESKPTVAERYAAWLAEAWALHTELQERETAMSLASELRMMRLGNIDRVATVPIQPEAERQAERLRMEMAAIEPDYIRTVHMRVNIEAALGLMR